MPLFVYVLMKYGMRMHAFFWYAYTHTASHCQPLEATDWRHITKDTGKQYEEIILSVFQKDCL